MKLLWLWLLSAISFSALAFVLFGGASAMQLIIKGWKVVEGTVVASTPQEHGSTTVRYEANSTSRTITLAGYQLKKGQKIKIYISNGNGRLATLEKPREQIRSILWLSIIAAIVGATIVTVGMSGPGGRTIVWQSLVRLISGPSVFFTGIVVALLAGSTATILSGQAPNYFWLTTGLALAGALLLCIQSWVIASPVSWARLLTSKTSMLGFTLIALAALSRFWF